MKCKNCKKRMQSIKVTHYFVVKGENVKVTNIPSRQCPKCSKIETPNWVLEQASRYAANSEGLIVDFAKCEAEETALFITTQMFW